AGGRPAVHGIIHRDRFAGSIRKRHRHRDCRRGFRTAGSGGTKGDRGRGVVVGNGRRDLLAARFGAVGDTGNIHDDGFVHFIQSVLHGGQRDRAVGAARGDDNGRAGVGVITAQSGGAGEGQVHGHILARRRREGGRHRGDTASLGHRAAAEAQGDSGRGIVVDNGV